MKNFLSIFQAACILKRCLFAVVLVICSHLSLGATDDLMKAENYYPGGKYSVFGGEFARGSVTGVINTIRKQETSHQAGPIVLKKATYDGGLYYEQHFSGHPWWEHGSAYHSRPLDINPFFGGIDLGSLSTTKAHIEGVLDHPDNGYDGEQGGGHAEPIGGRDYFYYGVTGEVYSTSIQPLNIPKKVNDIVNRINDAYNSGAYADGENRQPEDNSADNDRRRDLHSDGQPENGQPENADNGSWEDAEVGQPKSERSIADVIWGALKELASGARDYQADGAQWGVPVGAWGDGNQYAQPDPYAPSNSAEQFGANVAAIGSMLGSRNPASLGRHADDIAGAAANAARKAEKVADKANDVAEVESKAEQLAKNKAQGNQFEKGVGNEYAQDGAKLTPQVTLKTDNGIKTRPDFVGVDKNGKPLCVECKSSPTAPLTKNQKKAFPEIEKNGATVVGKGTPEFPAGTRFPPTKPTVVRPNSN